MKKIKELWQRWKRFKNYIFWWECLTQTEEMRDKGYEGYELSIRFFRMQLYKVYKSN